MTELEQYDKKLVLTHDALNQPYYVDVNTKSRTNGWVLTPHVDGHLVTYRMAMPFEILRAKQVIQIYAENLQIPLRG